MDIPLRGWGRVRSWSCWRRRRGGGCAARWRRCTARTLARGGRTWTQILVCPPSFFAKKDSVMDRGKKFSVFVKSSLINYAHSEYAVHAERESFILYAVGEMKCPSEFCTASLKHHLEWSNFRRQNLLQYALELFEIFLDRLKGPWYVKQDFTLIIGPRPLSWRFRIASNVKLISLRWYSKLNTTFEGKFGTPN